MDTVDAEERGYPLESCSEVEMLFGQGDVRISTLKTHIGEIEATLLDNVPTLISPVPIIVAGGSLHLEGGTPDPYYDRHLTRTFTEKRRKYSRHWTAITVTNNRLTI
jgi:hypothetical protein